jgi:sugar-specific transcriptional regulator TrmB
MSEKKTENPIHEKTEETLERIEQCICNAIEDIQQLHRRYAEFYTRTLAEMLYDRIAYRLKRNGLRRHVSIKESSSLFHASISIPQSWGSPVYVTIERPVSCEVIIVSVEQGGDPLSHLFLDRNLHLIESNTFSKDTLELWGAIFKKSF